MSAEPVRVGIIGAGANTRGKHIPGLQAIEGVEVISVCNRSPASSARAAQEFGIPQTYDNWNELVAAPDTNAIVIGTWPYLHCQATLAALAAGKHVLCEARMAMNAAEAWEMHAAAQANPHLVVQIVPSPMTLRVDATLQRLLAEGYVGEVLAIEVRVGGDFLDPAAPLHWRQNFDLSGFNIMSMGIWYEAVLRWVGEATRVQALGKIFARTRQDEDGAAHAVRVPEHVDVTADMASARNCTCRYPASPAWRARPKPSSSAARVRCATPTTGCTAASGETPRCRKFPFPRTRPAAGAWKKSS